MASQNLPNSPANYDSRWFIWTIVFLVVTGISLVSYILLSDSGAEAQTFTQVEFSDRKTQK